jgi:hypothetical protein
MGFQKFNILSSLALERYVRLLELAVLAVVIPFELGLRSPYVFPPIRKALAVRLVGTMLMMITILSFDPSTLTRENESRLIHKLKHQPF